MKNIYAAAQKIVPQETLDRIRRTNMLLWADLDADESLKLEIALAEERICEKMAELANNLQDKIKGFTEMATKYKEEGYDISWMGAKLNKIQARISELKDIQSEYSAVAGNLSLEELSKFHDRLSDLGERILHIY